MQNRRAALPDMPAGYHGGIEMIVAALKSSP
jgi:hypothetical protein